MPDFCMLKEEHVVHFISRNEFIVDKKIDIVGVPYSDYFKAYIKYKIYGDDNVSNVEIRYGMVFSKQTVFSGKMEKSGLSESRLIYQNF